MLGIVYPGAGAVSTAKAAAEAKLDGLVLEAGFPDAAAFARTLEGALSSGGSGALVLTITPSAESGKADRAPLRLVEGVRPSARNLADMGIRATASAEPWIDSNIWLVRATRFGDPSRPVWVHQLAEPAVPRDPIRSVADAAIGGGSLDCCARRGTSRAVVPQRGRRAGDLGARSPPTCGLPKTTPSGAISCRTGISRWWSIRPSETPEISHEYLNLVARRQVAVSNRAAVRP